MKKVHLLHESETKFNLEFSLVCFAWLAFALHPRFAPRQVLRIPPVLVQDPSYTPRDSALDEPMLRQAAQKGIKKTGLVYSPGKSWVAGIILLLVGVAIFVITLVTAIDD